MALYAGPRLMVGGNLGAEEKPVASEGWKEEILVQMTHARLKMQFIRDCVVPGFGGAG